MGDRNFEALMTFGHISELFILIDDVQREMNVHLSNGSENTFESSFIFHKQLAKDDSLDIKQEAVIHRFRENSIGSEISEKSVNMKSLV